MGKGRAKDKKKGPIKRTKNTKLPEVDLSAEFVNQVNRLQQRTKEIKFERLDTSRLQKQILSEGKPFGPYVLVEKIGAGGMGEIYKAHHPILDKHFAIKTLRPGQIAGPVQIRRFIREARVSRLIMMTLQIEGEVIILRNIGRHDETLERP